MKDDWTPGCNVKADVPDDQKGRHYDLFEEVVLLTAHLRKHGVFTKINEQVRFARRRFGRYDVIDFLAVQIALCDQRRAHPGGVLPAAPALCHPVHGVV
jgi:hypothetical protein